MTACSVGSSEKPSASAIRTKPHRNRERLIGFFTDKFVIWNFGRLVQLCILLLRRLSFAAVLMPDDLEVIE
jgi:hypothetical protein